MITLNDILLLSPEIVLTIGAFVVIIIDLFYSKKSFSAVAYKALNSGKLFAPTEEYLNYILEGKEFLSPEYYSKLESTETL